MICKRMTWILMFTIVAVFAIDLILSPHPFSAEYLIYGNSYGLLTEYGRLVNVNDIHYQYWRIVTSIFLHAGIPHLIVNLIALYVSGTLLESVTGSVKLMFIFFISGVASSTINMFFTYGAVGASGAIYGMIGFLFASGAIKLKDKYSVIKLTVIVLYIILPNLSSSTAIIAHIAGLLAGILLSFIPFLNSSEK